MWPAWPAEFMHERAADFAERAAAELDFEVDVHEFPEGTKTAEDAAAVIGCDVAQIASSIALVADELVVVITSGANRVDEAALAELRGVDADDVRMAEPDEVKQTLGWSIGGVPPFLHDTEVPVYLDETLTAFETVWAAAGTPEAVFPISPNRIEALANPVVIDVAG
jgi:prolyl-tRNA editing enzyme YbaK/EbsC (Cys-tRNA(Pro) deacylase)